MAEKYFPFNATDPSAPDRTYNADDVATFDAAMYSDGVVAYDDQLVVAAGTGMTTVMDSGYAWIRGRRYYNPASITITHDPADGTLHRIDRIVLRHSVTNKSILSFLLKGTSGASPVAPALTRTTDVWEIAIADVLISAGVTSITSEKITDQRANSAVCGMVSANATLDTSTMIAQMNAYAAHIAQVIANAEGGSLYELKALRFSDTLVDKDNFVSDATYADYPFRATVPLTGVTSLMDVDVRLDAPDAISGVYAPVATSYDGGIYLYSTEVPAADITIPRIICF